jgi:hypothetical protein
MMVTENRSDFALGLGEGVLFHSGAVVAFESNLEGWKAVRREWA